MIGHHVRPACIALGLAAGSILGTAAMADNTAHQDLLSEFQQRYGFPGATAAVALPDGEIVAAATRLADAEANPPMAPDTPMLAAGFGKSFVAATMLSQESDGVLSREDMVSEHLRSFDGFARFANHATMTVGDLSRHAAGLPDHVHPEAFRAGMAGRMGSGASAVTPQDAMAFDLDAEPLFDAGSGWAHTDILYLLLGLVIEDASGRTYDDLVAERFLDPLGLAGTHPSDTRTLRGLTAGYADAGNPFGLPPVHGRPTGALTVADFALRHPDRIAAFIRSAPAQEALPCPTSRSF